MTRILALDPGLATGYAYAHFDEFSPLSVYETGVIPGGAFGIVNWLNSGRETPLHTADIVVCERFDIDGTITGTWSARVEGVVMATLLDRQELVFQSRDDKAALLPTEPRRRAWLKERGFTFEATHDMDAITHLIVYLKRIRHFPTLMNYWPDIEDAR